MHSNEFHDQEFDQSTLLKLQFFRGYIRKWLPVFLADTTSQFSEVHIYDFFCGPGKDACGTEGSPLVILEEIDKFIREKASVCRQDVKLFVHFNDQDPQKVRALKDVVEELPYNPRCIIQYTELEFTEALDKARPSLQGYGIASLLIVDQFGWKAMSQETFEKIVACSATDLIFFVSSSHVRRFSVVPSVTKYLPLKVEELTEVPGKEFHRFLCERVYRPLVPAAKEYYLAPFSIKKEGTSNIYGLVFGSSKLLGLQKFLEVCWKSDEISGEANYDIDDDVFLRLGEYPLLPEDKIAKKRDRFERDLHRFLHGATRDNREVFKFTLESGFLSHHATDILRQFQNSGTIRVEDLKLRKAARRGDFYLSWKNFNQVVPRVQFYTRD